MKINISGKLCKEHKNIISDILKDQTNRDTINNIDSQIDMDFIERSYNRYEKNKKILNNEKVYFSEYFRLPENRTEFGLLRFNSLINETLQNNLLQRLKKRVLKAHLHEYLKEPEVKLIFSNTEDTKYIFEIIKRNLISQDQIKDLNTFIQIISDIISSHKNIELQKEAIEEKIREHNEYYSDNIKLENLEGEKYLLRFTFLSYPFIQKNTPSKYCSNNNFKAFEDNVGASVPSFIYYDLNKKDDEKRYFGYIGWNFQFTFYNEKNEKINKTEKFKEIINTISNNIKIKSNFLADSLRTYYSPKSSNNFSEEYFFFVELITVIYVPNIKKEVNRLNYEYNRIFTNNNNGMNYIFSKIEFMNLFIQDAKPENLEYIINNLDIFKNEFFTQRLICKLLNDKYVKDTKTYKIFFNLDYIVNNFLIKNYSLPFPLEKSDFLVLFICEKDVVGENFKNNIYFYLKDIYLRTSSKKEERLSAFNYVRRTLPDLVDDFIFDLYTNNINTLSSHESIFYMMHSTKETQQKLLNKFSEEENEKLTNESDDLLLDDDDDLIEQFDID